MRRSVRGPLSPLNPVREEKAELELAGEVIRPKPAHDTSVSSHTGTSKSERPSTRGLLNVMRCKDDLGAQSIL